IEKKLSGMPTLSEVVGTPRESIRNALQDNLDTCQARLANLQKARENSELIEAELARLESKISSITELAINRQDPQFVTSQVDQVASSLVRTEEAMKELQFATGLESFDDVTPTIIPISGVPEQPVQTRPDSPAPPRRRQAEDGISYY
ncbi:MAG: hypothetical protein U0790_23855, partial [Isosphaeraceae bacterium]